MPCQNNSLFWPDGLRPLWIRYSFLLSIRREKSNLLVFFLKILTLSLQSNTELTVPPIRWLGVQCVDWRRFNIPDEALLPMTQADRKRGINMLNNKRLMDQWPLEWKYDLCFPCIPE